MNKDIMNELINAGVIDSVPSPIEFDGYVCVQPYHIKTKGGRSIAQMVVDANINNEGYYLPCIAYGENADIIASLKKGDKVSVSGAVQSRVYPEKCNNELVRYCTVYDVAVFVIKRIE